MKRIIAASLLALAASGAYPQESERALVADIGRSTTNLAKGQTRFDIYRLGLRRDFRRTFWQGDRLRFGGYWEASANFWSGGGDDVFALALSPVFVLSIGNGGLRPYLEAGIGLALLSDDRMAGRDLSTSWQFEDRIGFGVRWQRFGFHYRYLHYSNADAEKPNNGVDAHVLGFSYRF